MWVLPGFPSVSGLCVNVRVLHPSIWLARTSTGSCSFCARAGVRPGTGVACNSNANSKFRAMAELVEDKETTERTVAPRRGAILASDLREDDEVEHSRTFLNARTEEELLSGIRKEIEIGRLPPSIASGMEEVYQNYRNAVLQSGHPEARELILSNMAVAFDRILLDVENPFVFSPHHKAIREPFDYYTFGQKYIRPLLDFRKSYVGNILLFNEIEEKLQQGHNIIFISNHQTEADPAVIALLLETTHPNIAEKMTFVAGDRVVTDPVCKPFSMGRNLICVYSKKHMYDIPELAEMKKRANTRSLKEMALLLRSGSQIIWIAPSGGRDRPDPTTGEWFPTPFDASSVDNLRRLSYHSGVPGHIYPLALLCYDVMSPPPQVEKEIGERRLISYHGVGLSVGQEMSFDDITASIESLDEAKAAFSQALYSSVTDQYNILKSAVHGNQGLDASNSYVSLSQPWQSS
ncbi:glycerol-3-phosphate acyltransferase ATS12, chloroplastic-like isoform X2 [Aristolochia californica]|uniref:glycerol-3-phosphate acyltransferase ATS12, chloroplastic-like isoform X2 n=1 Tax=Aristolochia californica TaxID=171875 RepID=UPI0035DC6218